VGFTQCDDAGTPALLYVDDPGEAEAIEDPTHAAGIQARLTRHRRPAKPGFSGGQDSEHANVPLSAK
jgi:hypothetical protein